jgi:tetratricopeptide (TPR) repeat protein/DNA-binding XRE family transcriptional regulator
VAVADEPTDAQTFGRLLRERRIAAGFTQEQLAERAGLGIRTIRDLERDRVRRPHRESIALLATALGLASEARDELARAGRQPPVRPAPGAVAAGVLVPRQLPPAVTHFVGRKDVLKILTEVVEDAAGQCGAVLVSAIGGMAGVGKTTLAVHWAHQVTERFPDGQLYVNLRGFGPAGAPVTPADAIRGFLDALGAPPAQLPAGLDTEVARYRSMLAGRRVLVVLDNAVDAAQVRPLLPGSASCLVIVTSRCQLAGLAASDGALLLDLDLLTGTEARQLLAARLGSERVDAEPEAAAEIAGLCGRLPLALAITAARAAGRPRVSLAALAAEFRDPCDRLDALDTGDPATSARTVFSWSSRQLTGAGARMFRLLGLHPGPDITAPAAASLAGVCLREARSQLRELTRSHLLTEHSPGRYACHDLLRVYAAEQAQSTCSESDCEAATSRMLDHYLLTAHTAAFLLRPSRETISPAPPRPGVTPEQPADHQQALAWFEAERHVLLAAGARAASAGFDVHAWQIPWAMADFLRWRGYWHEEAAIQRTAVAATMRLGDVAGQAESRRLLANSCARLAEYDEACGHLAACLALYQQIGDRAGQARTHQSLSMTNERQGRLDAALRHAGQALILFRATGDQAGQARSLNNIGYCHGQLGNYQQARSCCRQALSLWRKTGDRNDEATTLDSLGYAEHHLGHHAQAASCYSRALAIFRELGDRYYQADTLTHLGDTHQIAGLPQQARQAWQQALDILDDLHHPDADQVRARLGHEVVNRELSAHDPRIINRTPAPGGLAGVSPQAQPIRRVITVRVTPPTRVQEEARAVTQVDATLTAARTETSIW